AETATGAGDRRRASAAARALTSPVPKFPSRSSEVGTPMSSSASKIPDSVQRAVQAVDPNRWKALVFIALAQLMVVLDATIVNIALPSAQQDLGISDGNRQWVVTAYALAFGGLLLFGGR